MTNTHHSKTIWDKNSIKVLLLSFMLFVAFYILQMLNSTGIANSDNTMRLINLRDLLAGQSWFDPQQYRLGLDGGTTMHWSRLIDAPILVIYQIAFLVTQSASQAEFIVQLLWPLIIFAISLFGLAYCAKNLGNDALVGPICIIGTMCFYSIGIYNFGDLDHHNVQIALAIWLFALFATDKDTPLDESKPLFIAGILAVLMLGVGMEALPYIVVIGSWVALSFLFGKLSPRATGAFGLGFAIAAIALFLATIGPRNYFQSSCDAFSSFHLVLCSLGGFGLFASSRLAKTIQMRLVGLAGIAVLCGAALLILFPECLTNPLTNLDPNLRKFWLEGVIETRSIFDLWSSDPFQLFGIFGMGLMGLGASLFLLRHNSANIRWAATLWSLSLIAALIVTAWQQRGNIFAASFAIIPLAFIVSELRSKYLESENTFDLIKMVVVALPSINLFWWTLGSFNAGFFASAPTLQQQAASVSQNDYCYADSVFSALADEPKGVVLGATDIGVPILKLTPHRVLAAPYHRNTEGNLAMINTMIATPDAAQKIIQDAGVTLIADCKNSADALDFKDAAPNGLQAALHRGDIPNWLSLVEPTLDTPMVLYRVKNL